MNQSLRFVRHRPTMTAIEGGRFADVRPAAPGTVTISEIGDEEARYWDAEMTRRGFRP